MKRIFTLTLAMMAYTTLISQITLTRLPSGNNKKAMVGERVGLTDVLIQYSRPGVNGRDGKSGANWFIRVLRTRVSEIAKPLPGVQVRMKTQSLNFPMMY